VNFVDCCGSWLYILSQSCSAPLNQFCWLLPA